VAAKARDPASTGLRRRQTLPVLSDLLLDRLANRSHPGPDQVGW